MPRTNTYRCFLILIFLCARRFRGLGLAFPLDLQRDLRDGFLRDLDLDHLHGRPAVVRRDHDGPAIHSSLKIVGLHHDNLFYPLRTPS